MIIKDNILKVMELFFRQPERKFHLREMERITGLSMPGVRKIAKKLEKEGLLESKKEKMVMNYFSTGNDKFASLKRSYNMHSIFSSGFLGYLRQKYEEPEAIVLFGSYSRGEDTSQSDIDIAIVTNKNAECDLTAFEKRLGRKIRLHEIKVSKAEKEFLNTLANGIVLYGYLSVIQ